MVDEAAVAWEKWMKRAVRGHGVKVVDARKFELECESCGCNWLVDILPGAKIPRGFWQCPDGCNWTTVTTADGRQVRKGVPVASAI